MCCPLISPDLFLCRKNFGISYLGRDKQGHENYLSLMSDWDLGAAFASASKPYLQLKLDIKPSEDSKHGGLGGGQDSKRIVVVEEASVLCRGVD